MEIYKISNSPFQPHQYEHFIHLEHPTVPEIRTYKHCNLPIMGTGSRHRNFFYFDSYLDKTLIPQVREEIMKGFEKGYVRFNKIIANGLVPEKINGQKTIDSYLAHIDKYAPDHAWKSAIQSIKRKGDLKTYFHRYFGLEEPWEGLAMFREYTAHYEDKVRPSQWMSLIEHFPKLKKFVESLPFEYVGYVMIFKSKPGSPVLIHRDYFPVNHRVHFMNIRLEQQPRPFFLYDCLTQKKTYVDPRHDIYFFNEIDMHGIDPESDSHMTLRIEGQFEKGFLETIGLEDGETFNWEFERARKFLKGGQFYIEPSTDI